MTSLRPQVSVIVPAFGSPAPLLAAIQRLLEQEEVHLEIVVVDNDPGRGIAGLLPRAPRLRLVEPGYNTGFTGAINRGIAESTGEFVLFHNADLLLDPGHLATLIAFMRDHPEAGVCAGKILREQATDEGPATLDSTGIVLRRDRSAHDRGEAEPDSGSFDATEEVFAVSGAALFARRAALEDVAIEGVCLDDDFFMYKDDLDLAWRMRLRGWQCWYVPAATGVHARSGRGLGGRGYVGSFKDYWRNESAKAPHVRVHSLKNEWLLLVKYETFATLARDFPWIAARQAMLVGVTAVVAPRSLYRAVRLFSAALPAARLHRRAIRASTVSSVAAIRSRWVA